MVADRMGAVCQTNQRDGQTPIQAGNRRGLHPPVPAPGRQKPWQQLAADLLGATSSTHARCARAVILTLRRKQWAIPPNKCGASASAERGHAQ